FRFVGSDGVISVSFTDLKLSGAGIQEATPDQVLKGYNSVRTFSKAQQEVFAERYLAEHPQSGRKTKSSKEPETFKVPQDYDERYDHMVNFFKSVREGMPVYEDAVFGYRAAAPALLCNESYRQGRMIGWDPESMRVIP